jgi:hypothetical protein
VVRRRRRSEAGRAVVGYWDGSAVTLEEGAPALEPLVQAARRAL